MGIINKRVILNNWINSNTVNSKTVIELGSMFFEKLSHVSSTVETKVGIEIWEPYLKSEVDHFGKPVFKDCIKIHGDVLNYRNLVKDYSFDTVMIVDVLEHFDKDIAFKLINDLKEDFNKIILMVPSGEFPQDVDHSGFGAHEFQKHRSSWYQADIEKLEFTENILDGSFHSNPELVANKMDTGCWFCVWTKN
jgi:hypothetical protein